ncbi:MAG: hypothetical protein ACKVP7_12065 [Hyphomicrobiaceae bacterium]
MGVDRGEGASGAADPGLSTVATGLGTFSSQLGELVYTLQQSDEELKQIMQVLPDYMRRLAIKIAAQGDAADMVAEQAVNRLPVDVRLADTAGNLHDNHVPAPMVQRAIGDIVAGAARQESAEAMIEQLRERFDGYLSQTIPDDKARMPPVLWQRLVIAVINEVLNRSLKGLPPGRGGPRAGLFDERIDGAMSRKALASAIPGAWFRGTAGSQRGQ